MPMETRHLTLGGMFIALAVGLSYVLASFPNIELMLATVFVAGGMLGWRLGLTTGLLAETLFSTLNPYGMAPLPVLLAQVFSVGLAGMAGGWCRPLAAVKRPILRHLFFGAIGFGLTLIFDLMTTLGTAFLMGWSMERFLALMAVGSPFYLTHWVSNVLIFALLVPALLRRAGDTSTAAANRKPTRVLESTSQCD